MKLKRIYIFFILFILVFDINTKGQEIKEIKKLEFFYIDDSPSLGESGVQSLTEPLISRLSDTLEQAVQKKENNIWLYSSNRDHPIFSTSADEIKKIIHLITDEVSESPDLFLDKKLIREQFYKRNTRILESVTFHYFVSGNFCKSILDYYSNILLIFPKELVASKIITNTAKIEVNLYYSVENTFTELMKQKLEESINFYNSSQFHSPIKLRITEI
jgi:hypothetical protein